MQNPCLFRKLLLQMTVLIIIISQLLFSILHVRSCTNQEFTIEQFLPLLCPMLNQNQLVSTNLLIHRERISKRRQTNQTEMEPARASAPIKEIWKQIEKPIFDQTVFSLRWIRQAVQTAAHYDPDPCPELNRPSVKDKLY